MRSKSLTSQKIIKNDGRYTIRDIVKAVGNLSSQPHFILKDVLQVWNVMDTLYIAAGKNGNEHKPLSHCSNRFTNSYIATADDTWVHYFIIVWKIGKKIWHCLLQKIWHFSSKICLWQNCHTQILDKKCRNFCRGQQTKQDRSPVVAKRTRSTKQDFYCLVFYYVGIAVQIPIAKGHRCYGSVRAIYPKRRSVSGLRHFRLLQYKCSISTKLEVIEG